MNAEEFGERVARERIRKGMSQQALADLISVSRGYVAQIERGKKPSEDTFTNLIAVLGIPLADFFDMEKFRKENQAAAELMAIISPSMQLVSENLEPEKMLELVNQQKENEAFVNQFLASAIDVPMPSGPYGWDELSKADRKLVQQIINRLLKKTGKEEGPQHG